MMNSHPDERQQKRRIDDVDIVGKEKYTKGPISRNLIEK